MSNVLNFRTPISGQNSNDDIFNGALIRLSKVMTFDQYLTTSSCMSIWSN